MVAKVVAIGDSFLAGTELASPCNVWPALFATEHNIPYQSLAQGGHSIQFVIRTLFESLSQEAKPCLYVIHWPIAVRFEYVNRNDDTWVQVNPNAVLNGTTESAQVQKFYYQYVNSLLGDKWQALFMIWAASQALQQSQHRYSMTAVDDFLFDTKWHNPNYIHFLQEQCKSELTWFDDLPFHTWAKKQNFAIGPGGHPLEDAHLAAKNYLKKHYQQLLS